MNRSFEILKKISQENLVKLDTLLNRVLKIMNDDELLEIISIEKNIMLNSIIYDIKTKSGKILRIYFRIEYTNGIKRKDYKRIRNLNVFYIERS